MTQQRYAYLIGANGPQQTQITPLQYAEQDIRRLEQAFLTYPCQFASVKSVVADASVAVMEGLEEFAEACQNTDLLVVHFSGHAKSEDGELYLIRNNTVFQQNSRLRVSTTIKIRDIKELLDRCRARHRLLILDCCYSGTAIRGGVYKGDNEIEETLEQLKGSTSAILTACSFREKARELDALNDGQGGGFLSWVIASVCTHHFSAVAREDALSLTDIWNWLENTALNDVNRDLPQPEQIPRPHLLNDRVAGIDNEIWFTDKRRTFHDNMFTAEQRQREELTLSQQEEFLQQYCSGASVEDFDRAKVQEYAKLQRDNNQLPMQDIRDLCKRLGLTSGQYTPRRSSVLAFHRMPSRHLPSALVRVTMRGLSSEEPYLREDIEGSLSEQAEQTIKWLKTNLNAVSENIGAGQRIDRCEIPERALRELIVNAILHRNYNAHESIHVEITSQQVIITNPGRLDSEIEHAEPPLCYQYSHPQNPMLLRILTAQRWAEGRALGFKIIREEFEKYKLSLPEIHNLPNGLVQVVILRPELSIISPMNEKVSVTAPQAFIMESLPSVWNVPFPRNPLFTGRDELLAQLATTLHADQLTALSQPQAISGLGGIGKTQLALEYAYRYRGDYQAVLWAQANTRENLTSSCFTIAALLNLPEKDEQESARVITAVKMWLQHNTSWLLILDNADDLALARDFLPPSPGGQVLLTTRAQATGRFAHRLEVDILPPEQGTLFLLRRAGLLPANATLEQASEHDRDQAHAICEELGGLPLALDQAGAYLEETGCSLSDYQRLYQRLRADLLAERRGRLVDDHPLPVTSTWSLSFQKVEQKNAAASNLLRLCAFLSPEAIPEEIIIQGIRQFEYSSSTFLSERRSRGWLSSLTSLLPHLKKREKSPVVVDPVALDEAIALLGAYSLIHRNPLEKTINIHRLVQAVILDQMDEQDRHQWAKRAIRAVDAVFPEVEFETWPQCDRLLPHALLCAELITQEQITFLEGARLLNKTGRYLYERARYTEAESLYQRALSIREQQLGPLHPDTAQSLNNLAELYRVQGKYEQAEPLYQRALSIREQQLGPDHPYTATSLNNLTELYQTQGKYEQAEPLYQRALSIREQQLGPLHPDTAQSLNNLAELYYAQGKYEQAEPLYLRALSIREQQLGPDHPDTANSLNNLAALYQNQGKDAQAEPLLQRALSISEQQLGPLHPYTATSLNNLAELYRVQDKHEQAEALLQRALSIDEKALGPQHPTTQRIRANYADLLRTMGRDAEAAALDQP